MTLKIERFRARVRLSGDLRSEDLDQVKTELERGGTSAVLDVEEVALVDLDGVQFLNRCEANGVAAGASPKEMTCRTHDRSAAARPATASGGAVSNIRAPQSASWPAASVTER